MFLGSWVGFIVGTSWSSRIQFLLHNLQQTKGLLKTRVVSHFCLAIYIEKYVKAKERRIMETQIYFTMQKYNLQKNLLKETKILQDIITL
jgi:hypothetical protein